MHIIAYTFAAAVHCPACTRQANLEVDHDHPHAIGESLMDEHGLAYDLVDHDGNPIHPVFDIDEDPDGSFTHCGDCHDALS